MNSIGIFYKLRDTATPRGTTDKITADLHINYWRIPEKHGKYKKFLDFGILLNERARDLQSISFYFPFKISKNSVSDLGGAIKDSEMLCSLFNDEYTIRNIPNSPSYYYVHASNGGNKSFWLYLLGENNFSIDTDIPNGSLLVIKILSIPKENGGIQNVGETTQPKRNLYFRFRISDIPENVLSFEEKISNDFLQSAFSKTEMVDFRVNEVREMSPKAYEAVSKMGNMLEFSKIHFFFIGSSQDEQVVGVSNFKDCRLLNPERWNRYISEEKNTRNLIAYHWKWQPDNKDIQNTKKRYNIFVKTVYKSIRWWTVIKYTGFLLIISMLASFLVALCVK